MARKWFSLLTPRMKKIIKGEAKIELPLAHVAGVCGKACSERFPYFVGYENGFTRRKNTENTPNKIVLSHVADVVVR